MTQQQPDLNASSMPTKVNLRELVPGERVKMGDVVIEVVDNPQDGMWIRGKYISFPGNAALEGTEDQFFAADISDRA
jgi:hypothetical protein